MFLVVKRTNPPCVYCQQAINLLTRRGLPFATIELELVKEWFTQQGYKTVPQIFKDELSTNNLIGGFEELRRSL